MGKWFMPNAVRRSHSSKGTKRPLIRLLLLFNKHNWEQLEIQTDSEISRFAICNDSCPTIQQSEEFLVPKPPKKPNFSDDNSDSNKDKGQQEGDIPTFEAICSPSETHLLTQGELKALSWI
jgi:hypothetical protein